MGFPILVRLHLYIELGPRIIISGENKPIDVIAFHAFWFLRHQAIGNNHAGYLSGRQIDIKISCLFVKHCIQFLMAGMCFGVRITSEMWNIIATTALTLPNWIKVSTRYRMSIGPFICRLSNWFVRHNVFIDVKYTTWKAQSVLYIKTFQEP